MLNPYTRKPGFRILEKDGPDTGKTTVPDTVKPQFLILGNHGSGYWETTVPDTGKARFRILEKHGSGYCKIAEEETNPESGYSSQHDESIIPFLFVLIRAGQIGFGTTSRYIIGSSFPRVNVEQGLPILRMR